MKTDKKKPCRWYSEGICTVNPPNYRATDRVYPSKPECPRHDTAECYGNNPDYAIIEVIKNMVR